MTASIARDITVNCIERQPQQHPLVLGAGVRDSDATDCEEREYGLVH